MLYSPAEKRGGWDPRPRVIQPNMHEISKNNQKFTWMNKKFQTKFKHRKEACMTSQISQEEHRYGIWKAKSYLELNLAREMKINKKSFYRCINSERRTRENVGLLLNELGYLMTTGKVPLNALFASLYTGRSSLQQCQPLRLEGKSGTRNTYPQWRKIMLGSTETNYIFLNLWDLIICTPESWESWLMSLWGHSQLSL